MDIENCIWFGTSRRMAQANETTNAFEHLLSLYAKAISKYFGLDNICSAAELINLSRGNDLKKGDILLVDWFENKALPFINKYMNQQLPESNLLISQLEYEYYILEQEMGMLYPEDLRACLVNIINDLPDRIIEAKSSDNVSSGFVNYTNTYKPQTNFFGQVGFKSLENLYNNFSREHPIIPCADSFSINIEGMGKSLSNNKGSANIAGPLLF